MAWHRGSSRIDAKQWRGHEKPGSEQQRQSTAKRDGVEQRRGIVPLGGATNRMAMALPVSEKLAKATATQGDDSQSNG